ncbi:MAG: AAA family ATPase [Pseudonocardiaceae bacterium]
MIELAGLVPRHAESPVTEALADTRVVLVNGARQASKSTLTRLAASRQPVAVIRLLDDPATLQAAKDDPTGFVDHQGLTVIDEIQLVPELLRPIKVAVDLDPTPGRFLLTGSSRILALRTLPDALPGRMEVIELWQFSQGEISGEPGSTSRSTRPPGSTRRPSEPRRGFSFPIANCWRTRTCSMRRTALWSSRSPSELSIAACFPRTASVVRIRCRNRLTWTTRSMDAASGLS